MQSFFFGKSEAPLYGVIHEPNGAQFRNSAILICQPIGHEYLRSHRMVKVLAERLAEQGYYVMRFDYTGCGDSSGEFEQISSATIQQDIDQASDELRSISGQDNLIGIGLRMGAAFLSLAASRINLTDLVLWDPVIKGEDFIHGLDLFIEEKIQSAGFFERTRLKKVQLKGEKMGYIYSAPLIEQIIQIDLTTIEFPKYFAIKIVVSKEDASLKIINNKLTNELTDFEYKRVHDLSGWDDLSAFMTSITTTNANNTICEALS